MQMGYAEPEQTRPAGGSGPDRVVMVVTSSGEARASHRTIECCGTLKSACSRLGEDTASAGPVRVPIQFALSTYERIASFCEATAPPNSPEAAAARAALRQLAPNDIWDLLRAASFLDARALYEEGARAVQERIRARARAEMQAPSFPRADLRANAAAVLVHPGDLEMNFLADFDKLLDFVEGLHGSLGVPRGHYQGLTPADAYSAAYDFVARDQARSGARNGDLLYGLHQSACESLARRHVHARLQELPRLYEKEARAELDRCRGHDARFLEDVLRLHEPSPFLLEDFADGWKIAQESSRILLKTLAYLDRFHIPREKLLPLQFVARRAFAEHAYQPSARALAERLAGCFVDEACGGRCPPPLEAAIARVRQSMLEMTEGEGEWRRLGESDLARFGSYEGAYHGLFFEAVIDGLCSAWERVTAEPEAAAAIAEKYLLPRDQAALANRVQAAFAALGAGRTGRAAALGGPAGARAEAEGRLRAALLAALRPPPGPA